MRDFREKRVGKKQGGYARALDSANRMLLNKLARCPNCRDIAKKIRDLRFGKLMQAVSTLKMSILHLLPNEKCFVIPSGKRPAPDLVRGIIRGYVPRRAKRCTLPHNERIWIVYSELNRKTVRAVLWSQVYINTDRIRQHKDVLEVKHAIKNARIAKSKQMTYPASEGTCSQPFFPN
jgi:hypothetical protein